ncbi:DUF6507 family protein [Actinomadura rifamycini]|uniref:DUF6507 family protein n=1 Tax=Actinomadura rifamycini TaxID=31962 RepID=UPI00040636AB|nr:DUF6507 family protein [Actinomadura rifamycini]
MTAWDIDPQGVQGVINRTAEAFAPFEQHAGAFATGCRDAGTASGSTQVSKALSGFVEHHRPTLLGLRNRTQRTLRGAAEATNAYVRGDEEMAAQAQAKAARTSR